jgi:hypothetical protein
MDLTMSGRVTFSISLQPSYPAKSSRVVGQPWSMEPIAPSAMSMRSPIAAFKADRRWPGLWMSTVIVRQF